MKYKYQLITLGSDTPFIENILSLFNSRVSELNISLDSFKIINRDNFEREYLGNQPAFTFYFGDKNGNFKDVEIAKKLLEDGSMILPIFFTEDAFSDEIPKVLENQNGIQYKQIENDRIVNIALESFELLRNTRKIFISYRRDESSSVAIQLFEALESHNFDVFLDTHSVGKGEPFQEELWHRMADSDVIVLLSTPEFLSSKWCEEEFAEAGAKQIGIIQLVWPNHNIEKDDTSHISYPTKLKKENFVNDLFDDKDASKLKSDFLENIIKDVESIRARNLAARQDSLITNFRSIASKLGKNIVVQPERFLTEDLPGDLRRIFIPTIGVPQSNSCQTAEIRNEMRSGKVSIRLIYDDLRIRKKWIDHLDWLNTNLNIDIKTLKKQEFESWLRNN
ncbi:toll/interleukin-1 receptor domain-containing protein [Fibrella forsythiae]|uniref:Toll/interleukin-1 receptor domain-containing protein n=1 Tax=Fibrella forsythiae TaxID=2817061 RepID=A0ABS3JSB5_9BACT|nr:toll/interleukin-1 receptor domain-containing protein [Fibrella forsythiae]MBO0952901.1 toll/interleukin-1 receptor domain-containing protein [Fibrella forsythiae]